MKELIIKFEPFVFKQTVFIKHEDGHVEKTNIPQKEISSYISLRPDIDKVHFFGNDKFIMKFKNECITKYKVNNVKFYINC